MNEITLDGIRNMARDAKGEIDKIYLHWTAGYYNQTFDDYHINITGDGLIYASVDDLTTKLTHTWHRNSRAIGIAICCCVGAQAHSGYDTDFGDEPPTEEQIETLAKVVKTLCEGLELDINKDVVMTHCEVAWLDGYGPCSGDPETRWDLWYLPDSDGEMKSGGDVIRGKALWYLENK